MDIDATDRYSRVPDLCFGDELALSSTTCTWACQGKDININTLILSWAVVLGSLTGEDSPVFNVDGEPISANVATGVYRKARLEEGDQGCAGFTAILTKESIRPPDGCVLEISYCFQQRAGRLWSTGCMTASYLTELAGHLEYEISLSVAFPRPRTLAGPRDNSSLSVLNDQPKHLPGPAFLHELVQTQGRWSDLAVEFLEPNRTKTSLTYEQLHDRLTKLSSRIISNINLNPPQPRKNVVVPVLLSQSINLYVAWIAILKAGAAVCPLNLDTPRERLNFIVNDVAADVVVTTSDLVESFNRLDRKPRTVILDGADDTRNFEDSEPFEISPDSLAYIMYTSGSTGLPKGVGISHRAASQSLLAHEKHIPQFQRFLQFASPTFDVSVFEIFFPWFRGSTLVGCERRLMLNDLIGIINQLHVDAAELTPTVARELLHSRTAVPGLNILLTIGEMLTRHVVDEFGFRGTDDGILYGMYGPTEATIHCTIAAKLETGSCVRKIGFPLDTVSAFIISRHDDSPPEILPIGHVGELAIGGPQLARSYLNREHENKLAFLESKFGRLYRTGDKARMHPNGELECLGRITSNQIKLRGQRLELGEIESVIANCSAVRSVVVVLVEGILVAFVSGCGSEEAGHDLRLECQRWLPKFMVPADIVFMDKLPQLSSGKADRKWLEQEYIRSKGCSNSSNTSSYESELERSVARCAEEMLGVPVSRSMSLEAAGLDSLRAIRLSSSLRGAGVDCGVARILEADTVEQIAWFVRKGEHPQPLNHKAQNNHTCQQQRLSDAALDSLRLVGCFATPQDIIPCSPIQIAMVSESTRNPKTYSNWIELEFGYGVGVDVVKAAFSALAQRNEILRSGFVQVDLPGHSHAQVIWSELGGNSFTENVSFDYNMSFGSQKDMLSPFVVEFRYLWDNKMRALVHIHHALYDGWSWELMMKDLADTLMGKPLPHRPQYRSLLTDATTDENERDLEYWREHLENPTPTTWPNYQDRRDVPVRSCTRRRALEIDVRDLDATASSLRVSRPAIFQGAFAYLLSAYFGTGDIIFGTVSSGRTTRIAGVENVIGPCVLTTPSRVNLGNMRNVRDLVGLLHSMNRKSLEHGSLPLRDIKKSCDVGPEAPLFDSLFVWQDTLNDTTVPSAIVKEIDTADSLEFAMSAEFELLNGRLHAKATFQESIIPASQADMFLYQIEELATLFLSDPDMLLQDVNARLPGSAMSIENLDYVKDDDSFSLAHGVEYYSTSDPDRVAVEFLTAFDAESSFTDVQKLTYADLNARSNKLANYFAACGLRSGQLVGIVLDKSLELYISILAVIKTAGGYVPITPQTPAKRVNSILNEAECRICVTNAAFSNLVENNGNLIILDLNSCSLDYLPETRPPSEGAGSSPAYTVFTSGSTGVPKGVLISHQNMCSNLKRLAQIYPSGNGFRLLQACSHAFDVSVFEIFYSWNEGLTLCAATHDILFRDIEKIINALDVTHLSLTPTVAALVNPDNVPKVNFLVTAGEGMTSKVFNDWADRGLYQGYGPSETTNICTIKLNVSNNDFQNNIGRPLRNTSVFVVSEKDEYSPVPRGGFGEFCFGGTQVGLGYLNMPELTQKKFMEHPEYGRIYRSGDFGRLLPDGSLAFEGRHDDLVKLRGHRIELGEINNALLRSPDVKDCLTLVCENGDGDEKQLLASFWIASATCNELLSNSETLFSVTQRLFGKLSGELPAFTLPSFLVPIPSMPITTAGKVDRDALIRRLRQLDPNSLDVYARSTITFDDAESFSESESKIAEIISKVTQCEWMDVSRNTSFYRLGLDSISAISLSRQLKTAGFSQVDISEIMRNSSVASLSRLFEATSGRNTAPQSPCLNLDYLFNDEFLEQVRQKAELLGDNVVKVLPCTPLQEAMLSDQASGGKGVYINRLIFKVNGSIHDLRNAWETIVMRHDVFRTRFVPTTDANFSFAQVVLENARLNWEEVEISSVDSHIPIDNQAIGLTPGADNLPFKFTLFSETDTTKRQLHMLIHHALYDGESMARLLHEVEQVVLGRRLPPVVPYDLYLERMVSANTEEADMFWRRILDQLPRDHLIIPDGRAENRQFCYVSGQLALPLTEMDENCKRTSVTRLDVLQAAWAKLLVHYTGASDVCFGEIFNCRNIAVDGVERIVGPCFNALPIRIKVDRHATNLDLMRYLHKARADILPYQLTSLRRIQTNLGARALQLFDTLLLLQSSPRPFNNNIWTLIREEGGMDFPLVMEIIPNQQTNRAGLYLHFEQMRISEGDAYIVLSTFVSLVQNALNYPSARALSFSSVLTDGDVPSFIRVRRYDRRSDEAYVESYSRHDDDSIVGEWTKEELEVRNLLSSMSRIERNGIDPWTTVFQLGLDSINAIQITHFLKESGYDITSSDVMEAASIRNISRHMQKPKQHDEAGRHEFNLQAFQTRHWSSVCHQVAIRESDVESIRPCTPTQVGILTSFVNSDGDLYANTTSWRSSSSLDISRLGMAWETVAERNNILRTGFCHINDNHIPFAMVVYRPGVFSVPCYEARSSNVRSWGKNEHRSHLQFSRPPWNIFVEQSEIHTTVHFTGLHALYDAHSLDLIFSEVEQVYYGNTIPDITPIEPILGAILTQSLLESPDRDEFWQQLGKAFQPTKFPDMNPVHTTEHEICFLSQLVSKPLNHLHHGCQNANITLQAASQAAWARLLSSYTGENKVTYGVVLSGRTLSAESQSAIFPCLTTLPSNYEVEGHNRDLLDRIMRMNARLMKYQFTPLSQIQHLTGFDSSLFDTIFVFQKFPSIAGKGGLWDTEHSIAKTDYPVSVEVVPHNDQLEFCLTFSSEALPREQAEILLCQLDWLLIDTIFSPESECCQADKAAYDLVSSIPRKELRIPSPVRLLHEFVEIRARTYPTKIALEFATKLSYNEGLTITKWTYREFDDEGNKHARILQQRGASPGCLIAICFEKCPEAYFAILAILKIGCGYVALDPGAPLARKQFILRDAGVKMLLCTSDRKCDLESLVDVSVIPLDERSVFDNVSSDPPLLERPVDPHSVCYCLYTSGSTGTPKGCEISHDNAIQAMLSFQRLFAGHWDEASRWLQFAAFHFDVSVLEQYWSWSVGICVTSCPRDILFEDLTGMIRELEITHIDLTPSLARLLHPEDVPSLCRGVFITGGEKLTQDILDDWGKHMVIYNGYGPTEVTIGCTMLPRASQNDKPSNIGPQFDNVSSFVFRPGTKCPVLRGGVGELCVSGPLVGSGYLNRPQTTAEKFQFIEDLGERVYRTGDIVRMFHDGSFCFLGRIDDQVKLRGQRLEIEEINHVIRKATDKIDEVVTMVLKHPHLSKEQLVSFVSIKDSDVGEKTCEINYSLENSAVLCNVRRACYTRIPGYMIPTHIIPLFAFPLSPNNKIDYRQLIDLYNGAELDKLGRLSSHRGEVSYYMTKEMERVIYIVGRLTGMDEKSISPWSNIFELGMDSITAISFARTLKDVGFELARPSLIMKNPVVSAMVDAMHSSTGTSDENKKSIQEAKQRVKIFAQRHLTPVALELRVPTGCIEAITPCTPLQEGMIYQTLQDTQPTYLSKFNFELERTVEISQLKSAWEKTQTHIQLLRTKFVITDDGHALVVLNEDSLPWFKKTCATDDEIEAVATRTHEEWCETNVDLGGRLWEIGVVSGPNRKWMCLNVFHGLYDGTSLPLLLERVAQEYVGIETPRASRYTDILPQGPLCRIPDAESFWLGHLKPSIQTQLPRIENAPMDTSAVAVLKIQESGSFESIRRKLNVTEQAVIHACWLRTFVQYFKFVPTIGIVVSGRALAIEGAENVVGPMFNTIPCYISLSSPISLADVAASCHDYHISSLPYQHTALRDIMKWSGRGSELPLFDSLFAFQKESKDLHTLAESLWTMKDSSNVTDYPLAFEAKRDRAGLVTITIVARSDVLSVETAKWLSELFRDTLIEFCNNPYAPLDCSDDSRVDNCGQQMIKDTNKARTSRSDLMVNGVSTFQWTDTSSRLQREIAKLAGIDASEICEDTSILEIGLDSIDAVKLSSRFRKSGIKLPVSVIMRYRTIRAMMKMVELDSSDNELPDDLLSRLEMELRKCLGEEGHDLSNFEHVLPATPLQEGILAEMMASDYRRYFNHDVLELEENVDIEKLEKSWATTAQLHPILRTSFAPVSDPKLPFSYAQLVHDKNEPLRWRVDDRSEKTLETIIEEERTRAVESGLRYPPLSLRVLYAEGKRVLVVSISHALYDGWSLGLLHQDVTNFYAGRVYDRPSYHALLAHIIGDFGEKSLQFWKTSLEGVSLCPFPKRLEASGSGERVFRQERAVGLSSSRVISFCKKQGITAQCLGITCWALVLSEYLGLLDVLFGTVLLGRDVQNAEQIIFPAMNTVAIRAKIHGTCSQLLGYMQRILMDLFDHQHFPLRKVKALTGRGGNDLFDTLFIYQKKPKTQGSALEPLYRSFHSSSEVEFPLSVEMELLEETCVWRVASRETHLDEEGISKLLDRIQFILDGIIQHPDGEAAQFGGREMYASNAAIRHRSDEEQDGTVAGSSRLPDDQWTHAEMKILSIISTVAGIPVSQITKQTTLFHLGLDSISAIKVCSLLKKESITLTVTELLRAATVPEMAEVVRTRQSSPRVNKHNLRKRKLVDDVQTKDLLSRHNISPDDVENVMPPTAGQVFMLEMWHNSNGQVFNPCFLYRVKGRYCAPERLEQSWGALTCKLPILRTSFLGPMEGELRYVQVAMKNVKNPIVWRPDLRNPSNRWLVHPRPDSIPVTLYASYLAGEATIMLHIHHALYDAVSLSRVISLLSDLCSGLDIQEAGQGCLADFLSFSSQSSPVEKRKAFWQAYMGGVKQHEEKRSADADGECGIVGHYRPSLVKEFSAVEAASRTYGVTVQSLFLAVYAKTHASLDLGTKYSDKASTERVVVGVYLANRSLPFDGLSKMVAPTLNIVPLCVREPLQWPILHLARQIQSDLQEISDVQNSCVSLSEISDWTGIKLDTFVNFMKYPEAALDEDVGVRRGIEIVPLDEDSSDDASPSGNEDGWRASFNGERSFAIGNQSRAESLEPRELASSANPSMTDWRDIFKPGLDVEAAIRDDGLDVGVFGLRQRIDGTNVGKVLQKLRHETLTLMHDMAPMGDKAALT